jgi:carbon storage regulator
MLVLSRREEESIRMPDLGVTVKIVQIQGVRVKLAIEAPKDVTVCRKETARAFPDKCTPAPQF